MLARRFGLYFLLPMLLLLAAAETSVYFTMEDDLQEQVDRSLDAAIDAIDAAIDARLETIQSDLTVMHASSELDLYFQYRDFGQHDAAARKLLDLEASFVALALLKPRCRAFRFFDVDGNALVNVVNGTDKSGRREPKRDYEKLDVSASPWFREARDRAGADVPPYEIMPANGTSAVTIALPTIYGGKARGVLAIEICVPDLAEGIVRGDALGMNGYVYLVGPRGIVLAESVGGPGLVNVAAKPSTIRMREGFRGVLSIEDHTGEMVQMAYLPQRRTNLGIVTAVPHRVIFAPVYSMRNTVIPITIVGFLLLMIVGLIVVRRLVRPIMRLTAAAGTVAEGDLDKSIEVSAKDEIGELARSFHRMTEGLRDSRSRLQEALAAEEKRASELQHAYDKLQKTQRLLGQAEKMSALGQLAGGIAHDFNNLLSGIMSSADLMKRRSMSEEERAVYLDGVLETSSRAADLIRQLLAFSRAGPKQSVPVDLNQILQEVAGILKRTVDPRIQIQERLEAPEASVSGDPSQLQSAFLNLGVNARDAMPEGGTLTLSTKLVTLDEDYCRRLAEPIDPGRYVEASVSDTGHGMDREVQTRVFEPFFTTKEVGAGTGLGLAAVYGTVKGHSGTVNLYSEPGRGTVFRVYLPLTTVADEMPAAAPHDDVVHGSGRILLVDDEATIRKVAGDTLRWLGYDVLLAEDGAAALERYREEGDSIDLVIADLVMPKMSGQRLLQELKRLDPDVKVLIASGFLRDVEIRDLREDGAGAFLQKPFVTAGLSQAVAETLNPCIPPGVLRILVADDTKLNREVVRSLLIEMGHDVETASDGDEVLDKLEGSEFHILFLDVEMPRKTGIEVTELIRARESESESRLPIVAMTGHSSQIERQHCFDAGMDDFLCKPIVFDHLAASIRRVLLQQPRPLDWTDALASLGNRESLVRKIAAAFVEETPAILKDLHDGLQKDDAPAVHRAAHTLGGSMRYFDAADARREAAAVEDAARAGRLGEAERCAAALDAECRKLLPLIDAYARGGKSVPPGDGNR